MAVATGVSLAGPGAGSVSGASTVFTVALTPTGGTNAGDTVTPASTLAGTFTPASVSLSTATPSLTFTFTPTAEGNATISITDTALLTMPAPITYRVFGAAPALQQITGDAITPNQVARLTIVPNTYAVIEATITSLPGQLTAASLAVGINAATETLLSKAALIVDPGLLKSNGTYTAIVLFECLETDTALLPANSQAYIGKVTATATVSGGSHTVPALDNLAWQSVSG